jgi:small-conductance mechanosensitive channel
MIFYRSNKGATDRSVRFVRVASSVALVAYPVGALLLAQGPDSIASSLIGYGLILSALFGVALLTGSSTQRIVGEQSAQLDEYELQLRHRAMSTAYAVLTTLMLLAIVYAALAADKGGWLPTTYDEYNGLFWGAFLYAMTIPTACLSWRLDASAEQAA